MKLRGLYTACALLAIVSGVLWWSNRREARASKSADATKSTKLFTTPDDQIQEIKLQKTGAETIDLRRVAGKWQITAPQQFPADSDSVSSILSTLSSVTPDHVMDEHASDLGQYGLSQPSMKITIVEANNKSHDVLIGDSTPAGSASYAALAGDPRVFTIATYMKNSFDKSPNDLRDKRLLNFETDKVTRLELTAKKQTLEFGRNKEQWQIVKPKPIRADQFPVDELLRNLRDAKMELAATDDAKKIAAAFNSGTPVASAKITDASGTHELQVRKNKDDYYAKSTAVAGIYKVASSVGTGLDKSLDDFRNKKLFDFGYSDPEKVEIHDGLKSYSLSKSASDWLSNGTKMDESTVRTLIDKIRDLSASKFVETGNTSSVLDIAVTSDSGKRQEKLLISKNGDRYIAQRENEPALYELDGSAVSDLQKAASDLKPAPAPTPPPKSSSKK